MSTLQRDSPQQVPRYFTILTTSPPNFDNDDNPMLDSKDNIIVDLFRVCKRCYHRSVQRNPLVPAEL